MKKKVLKKVFLISNYSQISKHLILNMPSLN